MFVISHVNNVYFLTYLVLYIFISLTGQVLGTSFLFDFGIIQNVIRMVCRIPYNYKKSKNIENLTIMLPI